MSSLVTRDREQDGQDSERSLKRARIEDGVLGPETDSAVAKAMDADVPMEVEDNLDRSSASTKNPLPPSHRLLGISKLPETSDGSAFRISEVDVGISEYIGKDVPKIEGIIKQRFTDFLVYEVDLDGQVLHLKSLAMPEPPKKGKYRPAEPLLTATAETQPDAEPAENAAEDGPLKNSEFVDDKPPKSGSAEDVQPILEDAAADKASSSLAAAVSWNEHFDSTLATYLSDQAISQLKVMFLEGPEPPRASDAGWGGRVPNTTDAVDESTKDAGSSNIEPPQAPEEEQTGTKGKDRGKRGGRGGRSGKGPARGGKPGRREDTRKVLSDPISSKTTRAAFHQVIRELFNGKLDSETDSSTANSEEGSKIAIKWSKRGGGRGGGRGGRGGRSERGGGNSSSRGDYPPYIHFTLQKTNRDTQDALSHISRMVHVNVKDLSVAGTKDKRGVTVQRVSLRRGNKTVQDIWKFANLGRRSMEEATSQRGERGVRIADLNYRKASLELGMLKGNAFVISLRNVQVDSLEILNRAMNTVKHKGFINYYGMQRFGTASVPTHSIGLALLKSDWHEAVSLILQKRDGEHPDVVAAREAWLVNGDLDTALELMPRRVVAERCLLESYKKQGGDTRNAMGALSTIPRNLRLMYVHAYQSYVWNAIVSERIRTYGADKPIPGDLVFEVDPLDDEKIPDLSGDVNGELPLGSAVAVDNADPDPAPSAKSCKKSRRPWVSPRVKTLTTEDLDKYTIFDVLMPLPGKDVAYPGGTLGEQYREFLRLDGLDPENFVRKQKEYSLSGSYRKILHLPKDLTWSVVRYTDPDVPLAQADEDMLLGFDPPIISDDGKFMALQIHLTLGTAAYATMALREVTKTETSSHFQSSLTMASEDQKFKGLLEEKIDEIEVEEV